MTDYLTSQRNDFLLDVREAVKRNQVVLMIMQDDETGEREIISNGYGTVFDSIMDAFLEMPFLGRVPASQLFEQWNDYFDDIAMAPIYAFELEDGKLQIAILEYYLSPE